jgi:hypothetical protein
VNGAESEVSATGVDYTRLIPMWFAGKEGVG